MFMRRAIANRISQQREVAALQRCMKRHRIGWGPQRGTHTLIESGFRGGRSHNQIREDQSIPDRYLRSTPLHPLV